MISGRSVRIAEGERNGFVQNDDTYKKRARVRAKRGAGMGSGTMLFRRQCECQRNSKRNDS